MLPPRVDEEYANRGDSAVVPWLALVWVLAVGGAGVAIVRRRPA